MFKRLYENLPNAGQLMISMNQEISAGKGYYRIRLVDMGLGRNYNFAKRYIPIFHLVLEAHKRVANLYDPFPDITIKDVNSLKAAQHTIINPRDLTQFVPYRGFGDPLWMGLFAIPAGDSAKQMIGLLDKLADFSNSVELNTALGLTNILYDGVNSALGLNGIVPKIGWKGQAGGDDLLQGRICLVAETELIQQKNQLSIHNDNLFIDGKKVVAYDYFLFELQVVASHNLWQYYPEIRPSFKLWKAFIHSVQPPFNEHEKNLLYDRRKHLIDSIDASEELVSSHKNEIVSSLELPHLATTSSEGEQYDESINVPEGEFKFFDDFFI